MKIKTCKICGQAKPVSEFRNGLKCRGCEAAYLKDYVARNKARLAQYKRDYARAHPESVARAAKAYRDRQWRLKVGLPE